MRERERAGNFPVLFSFHDFMREQRENEQGKKRENDIEKINSCNHFVLGVYLIKSIP